VFDQLMKGFVDFVYMTGRAKRKFERNNPEEKVLAADASKGILTLPIPEGKGILGCIHQSVSGRLKPQVRRRAIAAS